jgi:hypothetical protein
MSAFDPKRTSKVKQGIAPDPNLGIGIASWGRSPSPTSGDSSGETLPFFEWPDDSRAAHWVSRVVYVTAKLSLADDHAAAAISALSPRGARLTSYGGVPIIPPELRKS